MSLRLLIADDEPPLRDWLRRQLAIVAPDAQVIAEAGDGPSALAQIEAWRPDAAFLDIRMPGLSGLDVAARTTVPCRFVFVTAYDEFAVQAFEQAAVDYLLKPVAAERLAKTLVRLRQAPPLVDPAGLLRDLLARLDDKKKPLLRWLRVGNGDAVELVDVSTVDRFEAADKYTMVHVGRRKCLIRTPLKELERQLDPDLFWRVHRSTLLRLDAVLRVHCDLLGRWSAELKSGGETVAISRRYAHLFRQM